MLTRLVDVLSHGNTGNGFLLANNAMGYRLEAHNNSQNGVQLNLDSIAVGILVYDNTLDGVLLAGDYAFVAQVTSYSNTSDGIRVDGATEYATIHDSLATDNGAYNISVGLGGMAYLLESTFTYNGSTGEIENPGLIIDQIDVTAPTAGAVTYQNAGGFDFLVTSGNVELTVPWPRGTTTATPQGGAIQETGGGGATAFAH